jgi:membrane protein DedA with SNARE-associated domain
VSVYHTRLLARDGYTGAVVLRQSRLRLLILLAPVVVLFAAGLVGAAVAPALLVREPKLLIAMSPLFRHLALASGSIDLVPFVAIAVTRLFATDPFLYVIGRHYGPEAVEWVELRSGGARRVVRAVQRAFARAGLVVLFLSPGPLVCLLAGVARMPIMTFVSVNLLGTAAAVLLIRSFGVAFAAKLAIVREFIAANLVVLTAISAALVLASVAVKRRRWRSRPLAHSDVGMGGTVEE